MAEILSAETFLLGDLHIKPKIQSAKVIFVEQVTYDLNLIAQIN